MQRYENDCVGCPPEMGCLGSSCPYKDVLHYYCDNCGEEIYEDEPFTSDGSDELCEKCYKEITGEEDEDEDEDNQ